jgi:uncharacterized protein YbaA (DUF1428 family)
MKMRAKPGQGEVRIRSAMDTAARRYGGQKTIDQVLDIAAGLETAAQKGTLWRTFTTLKVGGTRTADALHTAWLNALVSGPQTHALNIGGSAAFQLYEGVFERTIGAAWGAARSGVSHLFGRGPVTNRVYFGEVPAGIIGAREGFDDALSAAARTWKTGESAFGGLSKVESTAHALPRSLTPFTNALQAEDEFFKWMAYRGQLARFAYREAVAKGVPIGQRREYVRALMAQGKHSVAALDAARKYAERMTFTEELGEWGESVYRLTRRPIGKGDVTIGNPLRWIIPFMRTLINIQKQGLQRSPVTGLVSPTNLSDLLAGGAAADMAAARMTVSAAGIGLGAWLAPYVLEGRITGAAPQDPAERNLFQSQGKTPYSIRVGDQWISYQRAAMEPWGTTLATMVDMIQAAQKGENVEEIAGMAATSLYQNMLAKPGWGGLFDALLAMREPEQFAGRWVNRFVASSVPNLLAQAARTADPTIREARDVSTAIQSRIPSLNIAGAPVGREGLPAQYDLAGQAETYGDALGGNLVSPFWARGANDDPVLLEMEATRTYINDPPRKVAIDLGTMIKGSEQLEALRKIAASGALGEQRSARLQKLIEGDRIEFSTAGYAKFTRETGRMAHRFLSEAIADKIPVKRDTGEQVPYSALPLDEKQAVIRRAYEDSHKAYLKQLRIRERMAERELRELGITQEMLEEYMRGE